MPVVTPDGRVITSLAIDNELVGLANSPIHGFEISAHPGVLHRTLVGHESRLWGVCLVRYFMVTSPMPFTSAALGNTLSGDPLQSHISSFFEPTHSLSRITSSPEFVVTNCICDYR